MIGANRQPELVTAATVWPVTEAEVISQIKQTGFIVSGDTEYDFITDLKKDATDQAEQYMNRKLITQTWKMTLDCQPDIIYFPFGWLLSIVSAVTVAEDDTTTDETTRGSGSTPIYHTKTGENGRIYLKQGYSWTTTSRNYGLLVINFTTGYDATGAKTPPAIKDAILKLAAFLYYNRENPETSERNNILKLLDPWRVLRIY